MDVDEEVVDETQLSSKEEGNVDWKKALPENAGGVCDISNQACWTLSSCKTGMPFSGFLCLSNTYTPISS